MQTTEQTTTFYVIYEPCTKRYLSNFKGRESLPEFNRTIDKACQLGNEQEAVAAAEALRDLMNTTFQVQVFQPEPRIDVGFKRTGEPALNIDAFWSIIETGVGTADPIDAVSRSVLGLSKANIVRFIQTFDELLERACTYRLWGAAFLMLDGCCGDDGFLDFRYSLIAKGREIYESAVADPDSLADVDFARQEDWWMERFGYIGMNAYEGLKTGKDVTEIEALRGSRRALPDDESWDFHDDDQNRKRLPRIFAKLKGGRK